MKREEFVNACTDLVQRYIDNFYEFDSNPQLRVNPALLLVEIESGSAYLDDIAFSDEVIENAAYAEGDETESASDFQASQDYDYYPLKKLLKFISEHKAVPDKEAIENIADKYF